MLYHLCPNITKSSSRHVVSFIKLNSKTVLRFFQSVTYLKCWAAFVRARGFDEFLSFGECYSCGPIWCWFLERLRLRSVSDKVSLFGVNKFHYHTWLTFFNFYLSILHDNTQRNNILPIPCSVLNSISRTQTTFILRFDHRFVSYVGHCPHSESV